MKAADKNDESSVSNATSTKNSHGTTRKLSHYSNTCWLVEDPRKTSHCVLTSQGVENIANHKYAPGHYTHLDKFLDPFWNFLTNLLPLWMAPNMVTTLGGLHCAVSYVIVRYFCKDYNEPVPNWIILLCAYCTFAYYTLDCMDGKQARRTQQSSPLGQLFDHGTDCICNLSMVSTVACFTMCGENPSWFFLFQGSLQCTFFMAQWEEYYTGILSHAVGNYIGVTEITYGLAFLVLDNCFIDRETFWKSTLRGETQPLVFGPIPAFGFFSSLQLRHLGFSLWITMLAFLAFSSISRVFHHVQSNRLRLVAVSKLGVPLLLAASPFILPLPIRTRHLRILSEALALLFFLLTKKIIVFSMAKMSYASIQLHIVPYLLVLVWIRLEYYYSNSSNEMTSGALLGALKIASSLVLLKLICLFHLYLELSWVRRAIRQICNRLDINCFTIKHKKV